MHIVTYHSCDFSSGDEVWGEEEEDGISLVMGIPSEIIKHRYDPFYLESEK